MSAVLEVADLVCGYGERTVLAGVTFALQEGECVGIAGPNGAGKSTLLWCLAGLLEPRSGKVLRPPATATSLVFQNPEDQLFLPSIHEDLVLPLWNAGVDRAAALERAQEALASVGLAAEALRSAGELSLGQRKRAAIALALVTRPRLLLLDEPTSELDGRSVRTLISVLKQIPAAKLVSSHHVEFLREVCDRVLLLDGGGIAAEGEARVLLWDRGLLGAHGLL